MCSDTDGAHNGTAVRATIGEPVNVSFCVDTDNEVNYIIIQPPYPASTQDRVSEVRIVNDRTRAIINITINPVVQSDFSERFNVTVFRKPLSRGTLLLWFQLEKKESMTMLCSSVLLLTNFHRYCRQLIYFISTFVSLLACTKLESTFHVDFNVKMSLRLKKNN